MDTLFRGVLSNSVAAALLALLAFGLGLRIRRPALLHGLWLLVFLKLLTPPILSATLGGTATPEPAAAPAPPAAPRIVHEVPVPAPDQTPFAPAVPSSASASTPIPWSLVAVSSWIGVSLAWTLLVLLRLRRFRTLLSCARPAPDWLMEEARALAARLELPRVPSIQLLPGAVSPMIFGFGRAARVLVPEELLASVTRDGARSLLAHELAHLRRRDHWIRAIELIVIALYWWLPVVWWARRELRKAEEECCDAWVVWALPEKESDYAQALVQAVSLLSRSPAALPPAASGIGQLRELKRRIAMVMDARTPHRLSTGARSALIALALLVPMIPAWAQETPAPENAASALEQRVAALRAGFAALPADSPARREKLIQLRHAELDLEIAREELRAGRPPAPPTVPVAPSRPATPAPTMPKPDDPMSAVDPTTGSTVRIVDDGRSLECITKDGRTAWRTMLGAAGKTFRQLSIRAEKVRALEGTRVRTFDLKTGLEEETKDSPLCPGVPPPSHPDAVVPRSMMPLPDAEKDAPKPPAGKIALVDAGFSRVAIDLRIRDGARPGMRLEVRRQGQRIGTIQITETAAWGSWAKPESDLSAERLQKGDIVMEIGEKEPAAKAPILEAPPAPSRRGDVPWYGQKLEGQDLVDVLKARLEIQKAKLREADIASQHAKRRLAQIQDLYKAGLASQGEKLDRQKEADLCQSQVEVKQAEVNEVEVMLRQAEAALRKPEPGKPR